MINTSGRGRAVVIGFDGTPYSFLKKEMAAGNLPHLAGLAASGQMAPMTSELPTVSSVAWSSFMTGKNPGEHGIYGFTDREPGTYQLYFPNYSHLKAEPFWDRLSREGKRCCVINVPSTYPARPLNGVLISGFVAPSLERAVFPGEAYDYLSRSGYRIDVDASKGHTDIDALLEDLHNTTAARREALFHFFKQERWDFFMCVFTGTDRLHHFLWRQYEENDPVYAAEFLRFYQKLDGIVGEFIAELPGDMPLFFLSDHGFCSLRRQIYINYALRGEGLLNLRSDKALTIADMDPQNTRAYCLDPGRVYVNLQGREPEGVVQPGAEYDELIDRLKDFLLNLQDPESGENVTETVERGRDIYHGPCLDIAPDLVAMPKRGFDFKGAMGKDILADTGPFTGMHTYDDATLLARGAAIGEGGVSIRDVAAFIESSMRQ